MSEPNQQRRNPARWAFPAAVVLLVCVAAPAQGSGGAQSATYRLEVLTTNGGGEPVSSTSYSMHGSAGQEATTGTSGSFGFIAEAGFWAFQGTRLGPVLLTVDHDGAVPENPALSWTGTQSPFIVHRATDCTMLGLNPHVAQNGNSWTDASPPPATLVCYAVIATAPGDGQ